MTEYRPGVCNIGARQRRRRVWEAAAAFLVAGVLVGLYLGGGLPKPLLAAVFVPVALGVEWAIEAYEAFCVRFALLGRYDLRGDCGDAGAVASPADRRRDRAEAAKLTGVSVLVAGAVTTVLVAVL